MIGSSRFGWYKIGRSKSPITRVNDLGILLPFKIEVFAVWKTTNAELTEALFHDTYTDKRINGEWFSFAPSEVKRVIESNAPYDSVKIYPGQTEMFAGFTNINEDIVTIPKRKLRSVKNNKVERTLRKSGLELTPENFAIAKVVMGEIGQVDFSSRVHEYLRFHEMENTPENRKIASKAVRGNLYNLRSENFKYDMLEQIVA